ncbi:MAG: hypothetical protein PQ612_01580 [Rickettsiales bacterium]|nr:hypothetical protein [Pseudomonadota bacterium]MDA0965393.1 hypothetical protein [Pseudomonadota bacterium]MDG4544321.1 hypothetical protein [Rickettsiales bacterium]MDG4544834.1 hypothetical protein [Rickettsiales bacterium]MDG4546956.1 hypothetical protein [Rickettsiales bacterium]
MKKFVAILVLSSLPYQSYANCANNNEIEALDFKAIQSSMMVAALSCEKQKEYNKFMNKYNDKLSKGGNVIKSYFKRIYGDAYESKLSSFVTKIANIATKESMTGAPDDYCNDTEQAFKELLSIEDNNLARFTSRKKFSSFHGFPSC